MAAAKFWQCDRCGCRVQAAESEEQIAVRHDGGLVIFAVTWYLCPRCHPKEREEIPPK